MQLLESLTLSVCCLVGGKGAAPLSLSNAVLGVNSKCSCPEEGQCGRVITEENVEELQDEGGKEEEGSVRLCRAGGGGGGGEGREGSWNGGCMLKGSSIAWRGSRMS